MKGIIARMLHSKHIQRTRNRWLYFDRFQYNTQDILLW